MTHIFVNIPTNDLERAKAYYTALGCELNPLFTDDNAACVVWSENIFFMVLTREYFATFNDKEFADPKTHAQVLISISRDSREDVDRIVEAGVANGGTEPTEAMLDELHDKAHQACFIANSITSEIVIEPREP